VALSTTTGIALYAAVIASGGLGVQLVREWRTWSTRLKVEVQPHMSRLLPGSALTGEPESVVVFNVINHSNHVAKVMQVGTEPIKDDGKSLLILSPLPFGTPGPWPVEPHDSISFYQPHDTFSDGDPSRKTRVRISTSDGKTFRSKRLPVTDLLPKQ